MAIQYDNIDKSELNKIIDGENFNCFKKSIERKLNIQNITHNIMIKDMATDKDNFKNEETNASLLFENDYSQIKGIVFYTEAISRHIENQFGKISCKKDIIYKIEDIFIKNALVHELVHIYQFEKGKLTKEIIKREKKLPYEEKSYEKEAKKMTEEIISSYGEFEKEIVEYINGYKSLDNYTVKNIIELYSKQFIKK